MEDRRKEESRRDVGFDWSGFGSVENKAKHGKVKVCCEMSVEWGNGDGARYPEAGARARTDKTGETRLEEPRAG